MIMLPETLLQILLATILATALLPILAYRHNSKISFYILLFAIMACIAESLSLSYFYINSVRASWKILSIGIVDIEFYLEPFGIIFLNLLTILWFISILYTIPYMVRMGASCQARFLTFIGLTIFSSILVALSRNLFTMFIAYEMLTLFTIPLVAYNNATKPEVMNYVKILLSTSIGLFLPFVMIVHHLAGNADFVLDGVFVEEIHPVVMHLLLFCMIFGIAKSAIFPIYNWLTSAMIAPYPVSALLHAVAVVKAGIFCMIKIIIYIFGLNKLSIFLEGYNWPLALVLFTLLYTSYQAVRTSLVKHVLAYSTISNLSFMMLSIFLLTPASIIGAIAHMVAHSFTKITLFFAAGIFYTQTKSSHLKDLRGIGYQSPVAAIFFVLASLSMIGIYPLAGAASKNIIWQAVIEHQYSNILKSVLILYVMASTYYIGRLCYLIFARDGDFREKIPMSGMKLATALSAIGMASFPICNYFINLLLWPIL